MAQSSPDSATPSSRCAYTAVRSLWSLALLTTLAAAVFTAAENVVLTLLAALAIGGLAIAGLGVANVFPLSVALALDTAGELADVANGFSQMLGGVVVLLAPFACGVLASATSLTSAFLIAPLLSVLCGGLLLASARLHASA